MKRALFLCAALAASAAWAHKPSDSYLRLQASGESVHGRWDLALRDAHAAIDLDSNRDGQLTWAEVKAQRSRLYAWALAGLKLEGCALTGKDTLQAVRHSDGEYAVLEFTAACPAPVTKLPATYSLLFDVDAQHRGLVRLVGQDGWLAFSKGDAQRTLEWKPASRSEQLGIALREGVRHIAEGIDHLCFLFALLFASVLRRKGQSWEPVELKPALTETLKVVTSFTVAHSITLGLSAFGVVSPEPKWVELAIAFSVAVAALNNLFPLLPEGRWSLAFGLGLLHGFGLVSALRDLGEAGGQLWVSVLGFNLGVELGQLILVVLFVPLAWAIRRTAFYRLAVVQLGSVIIFGLALYWMWDRV